MTNKFGNEVKNKKEMENNSNGKNTPRATHHKQENVKRSYNLDTTTNR